VRRDMRPGPRERGRWLRTYPQPPGDGTGGNSRC
jgi:hypothetical protein